MQLVPRQLNNLLGRVPDIITQNGQIMSVVYVTKEPNFTGVIGGYSTATEDDTPTTRQASRPTSVAQSDSNSNSRAIGAPVQATGTDDAFSPDVTAITTQDSFQTDDSSASATAIGEDGSITSAVSSGIPQGTTFATSSFRQATSANTAAAGIATSTSAANQNTSSSASTEGMTTGGKIGLAVGIICGIGAVLAIVLLLLAKKRRQKKNEESTEDEKNDHNSGAAAMRQMSNSSPNAPRLSLRPVSRLVPEMMGGSRPKSRLSQGNMLTTFNESNGTRNLTAQNAARPSPQMNGTKENPFQDPVNPFADPEKTAAAGMIPASQEPQRGMAVNGGLPSSPAPPSNFMPPAQASMPVPAPISIPPAIAAIPAAPSPVVAQGPGPEGPAGNVYRILMDFRPTMDDELELISGQLVRLLHEYDDGWALCIKLDRSQQGVVPRTCLAAKPSKPRPAAGPRPNGANSPGPFRNGPPPQGRMSPAMNRPMTPNGRQSPRMNIQPGPGAPTGPNNSRPASPGARSQGHGSPRSVSPGAFNQAPRPLSPGPRPSPQMGSPNRRSRSNSASAASVRDRRNSPPGPSKLGPNTPPPPQELAGSPGVAY